MRKDRIRTKWEVACRHAMLDKGWGMNELAEACGMTRQHVSALVCGSAYSTTGVITIAQVLDLPAMSKTEMFEPAPVK